MAPRHVRLRLLCGTSMLLLAGCAAPGATTPASLGAADRSPVPTPPAMAHYSLPMGDISSGGTAIQRTAPVYPPALLAACPASFEVRAQLRVDRAGRVSQVIGVVIDDAGAAGPWHQFFVAVRAAALQWRFNPLQVTRWAGDVEGNSHVVDSANRPFKRTYVFRFVCHAGKSTVSVRPDGA